MKQRQFQEGLSFDDVLLLPQFSEARRSHVKISPAALAESHLHSIIITNKESNYEKKCV